MRVCVLDSIWQVATDDTIFCFFLSFFKIKKPCEGKTDVASGQGIFIMKEVIWRKESEG